jgi:hypothetical protein
MKVFDQSFIPMLFLAEPFKDYLLPTSSIIIAWLWLESL